jgi:hypothetical protein
MADLAANSQFPLNAIGQSGQNAFVGVQRVFFTGSTGLIGTMYGVPGVTATRVSTGVYRFRHDPTVNIDILAGVEGPTGTFYAVNIPAERKNSNNTGTFDVHMAKIADGIATGLSNPATGTALKLMFFCSPVTKF